MGARGSKPKATSASPTKASPSSDVPSKEPPQSPPKQPGGAELRRNPATGTVVLIAPERLARLRTDPFRLSQAGLHEFPVFDEEGGLAWRDLHKATFERLKGLAAKLTRPMHISTLQDACLLFNEGDGDGLPMHERSTMPYVCRLIASELPPEQKPLLLGAAGKCPFCAFCLSDVAKPGETVKLDAALCEDTLVLRSPDGEILSTLLQNTPDYLRYFDQPTSLYPSCLEQLAPSLRTYLKSEVCTELSSHRSCTWLCRVVDQKFPALRPKSSGTDDDGHVRYDTLHERWPAVGVHDLFLDSPRHNVSYGSGLSLIEMYSVVCLWDARYRTAAAARTLPPY